MRSLLNNRSFTSGDSSSSLSSVYLLSYFCYLGSCRQHFCAEDTMVSMWSHTYGNMLKEKLTGAALLPVILCIVITVVDFSDYLLLYLWFV